MLPVCDELILPPSSTRLCRCLALPYNSQCWSRDLANYAASTPHKLIYWKHGVLACSWTWGGRPAPAVG
ncbi:hypothetical protein DFAR_1860020 [Desulfarculales bacterium]